MYLLFKGFNLLYFFFDDLLRLLCQPEGAHVSLRPSDYGTKLSLLPLGSLLAFKVVRGIYQVCVQRRLLAILHKRMDE